MTIGVVTALIETGMIPYKEPETVVRLETPAGLVTAKARISNGRVKNVSFQNVPSFLYRADVSVIVPEVGEIIGDIAFGGNFYYIVNMEKNNLKEVSNNVDKLIDLANKILERANALYKVSHPQIPEINKIDAVVFTTKPSHPKADLKVIYVKGTHIDRSPCGTGTSAVMATLYSKGLLNKPVFISESILGTLYKGKILGTTKIGNYDAIIPEITGKAWIHAFSTIVIEDDDPFMYGFRLREGIVKIPSEIDPYTWISDDS